MRAARTVLNAAALAGVGIVILLDLLALAGLPAGPLALAQLLAAHLTLLALVVIPLAVLANSRWLGVAMVVLVVLTLARFSGEWWSGPVVASDAATSFDVLTWNLEIDSRAPADALTFLRPVDADVIAFQELTPAVSAAIEADPDLRERYPYRAMYPTPDVFGLGILSAFPLSDVRFERGPSRLLATVATPAGPVRGIDVHPLPGRISRGPLAVPVGFDTTERDAALGRIRDTIAGESGSGPVLVLGDINTAPTEPEFGRFAAGFLDAHAEVGLGPGWTYRPSRLESLGIGLIRIDVVLTGPGLRPTAEATICPPVGDHCAVRATIEIANRP